MNYFEQLNRDLKRISENVKTLRDAFPRAERVILFGSCAGDDYHSGSDIDVCVVGDIGFDERGDISAHIGKDVSTEIDFVFCNAQQLKTSDKATVHYWIEKEGLEFELL